MRIHSHFWRYSRDFNLLVNKMCVQYRMENTLMIVAGDCGLDFKTKAIMRILSKECKRMDAANNWILFVRGTTIILPYFDGKTFRHKRFIAIPDYSIVKACGHTLLCIGGAISIDRSYRLNAWEQIQRNAISRVWIWIKKYTSQTIIGPTRNLYSILIAWKNNVRAVYRHCYNSYITVIL